jgi:iron complex transport system substrate-binding protein
MLKRAGLIWLLLLAAGAAWAEPRRVVSTNLCADQLVLLLADREQIASLSRTVFEPALSNVAALAQGIPQNHERVEEIIALKPDLVVSSEYRELAVNALLQKMGLKVVTVPSPQSLEESRKVIRNLSRWLGHPERGDKMIADMDRRLKTLAGDNDFKPRTLVYQANGGTIGAKTLAGDLISHAGLYNMVELLGIERWGNVTLEQVMVANLDVIIFETDGQAGNSLAQMAGNHPLFRDLRAHRIAVSIPTRLWICPGPWNVEVVEILARARKAYFEGGPSDKPPQLP